MPGHETVWTVEMLRELPEDGNRYEIIDGALLLSPSPAPMDQRASTNATSIIDCDGLRSAAIAGLLTLVTSMTMIETDDVRLLNACPFCGRSVRPEEADTVELTLRLQRREPEQIGVAWFVAHLKCVEESFHERARSGLRR